MPLDAAPSTVFAETLASLPRPERAYPLDPTGCLDAIDRMQETWLMAWLDLFGAGCAAARNLGHSAADPARAAADPGDPAGDA